MPYQRDGLDPYAGTRLFVYETNNYTNLEALVDDFFLRKIGIFLTVDKPLGG
jgi:hypothetical protein